MTINFNHQWHWIIALLVTFLPYASTAGAFECLIFPATQNSSTTAYSAPSKVYIAANSKNPDVNAFEVLRAQTPAHANTIGQHSFTTESRVYESCETAAKSYDQGIKSSYCTTDPIYSMDDQGIKTITLSTIVIVYFSNGVFQKPKQKWQITENKSILRVDANDSRVIRHVQYVGTSSAYYSCR